MDPEALRHGPGRPGRLSALSVFHSKSVLYGVFVWVREVLNIQKRRFLARAVWSNTPCSGRVFSCPVYAVVPRLGSLTGENDTLPLGPVILPVV